MITKIGIANYVNNYQNYNHTTFTGSKSTGLRKAGYAFLAATMLTATSCTNKSKSENDTTDIISQTEQTDSFSSSAKKDSNKNNQVQRYYHYFPKEEGVTGDQYDWTETIYPDGRIEKDSMGHQITITPEGERTVITTENDDNGNKTVTTDLPDSTKIVQVDYKTNNPNEILHTEKIYWENGNIKESKYYNEYPSDSTDINSPKITEESHELYNENGVLIFWEINKNDSLPNDSDLVYDKRGRIIYDNLKNEKYLYKGKHKTPYRSISIHNDCQRITEYNKNGSAKKIYFKASDGTITKN